MSREKKNHQSCLRLDIYDCALELCLGTGALLGFDSAVIVWVLQVFAQLVIF